MNSPKTDWWWKAFYIFIISSSFVIKLDNWVSALRRGCLTVYSWVYTHTVLWVQVSATDLWKSVCARMCLHVWSDELNWSCKLSLSQPASSERWAIKGDKFIQLRISQTASAATESDENEKDSVQNLLLCDSGGGTELHIRDPWHIQRGRK